MKIRKAGFALIAALAVVIGALIGTGECRAAEEKQIRCWVMCRPGSQVNVRRTPERSAEAVGYLEVGDWFMTDAKSRNGFIRCYGIGEYGEGWIYCGYVVTEEPEAVFGTHVCTATKRVACRKWIGGDQESLPWLKNGSTVQVFYMADGWAVTSRGYIRSEWLEEYPE